MQVEADVRSCTYVAGDPKSAWSVGGPDSPLSDAGIWEDAGTQEVGEMTKGGQHPPGTTFVYSEAALTGSEAEAGQVPSAQGEVTPTSSISPEANDEKVKPWSPEGGGHPSGRQTPTRTCHSWSVSEQEAKGARTQSQRIAAQLTTPPSPNSKGVLLFNRRKKRVNEFTQRGPGAARPTDVDGGKPGGRVGQKPSEERGLPYFEQQAGMEEEARLEGGVEAKAGGEDQQAAAWPDPTEDYMELPAETRRREAEASAFRPSGLLPPVARPGKTGLLEQSRLRAAGRRPMFTFHERPRLAPNPELLSLVHGSDVQRKVGGSPDDTLGLGDEACTLSPHQAPAPAAMVCAGEEKPAPEWASCLKPPELRPPRRPGASQCLAEVRGKGAELFARRQTRMERFTIEAPLASERQLRPTSPTASLPPSWRCGGSPGSSSRPSGLVGGSSRPSGLVGVSSSAFLVKAAVKPGLQHLGLASPPPVRGAPGPRPEPTRASPRTPPPPTAAKPPSPRFNCTDTRLVLTTRSPPQADPRPTETPQAPRPTETSQAPRPTFSAGRAGLEAQGSPVTPPWKTTGEGRRSSTRTYLDTVQSDPANSTVLGSPRSPPCPLSPTAAVLSPTSWTPPRYSQATKLGSEVADSRRLKDLLAKNVVSAARRKKLSSPTLSPSSPGDLPFSLSPRSECLSPPSPSNPSPATLACSPLRMYRRSLTDSEFSLGSDDSGARSPSYYNFCPRGWTGSRVKQSEQ